MAGPTMLTRRRRLCQSRDPGGAPSASRTTCQSMRKRAACWCRCVSSRRSQEYGCRNVEKSAECEPYVGRGRELTLLGKWAIFFTNYLLVNSCEINTERLGAGVEAAVYDFLLLL